MLQRRLVSLRIWHNFLPMFRHFICQIFTSWFIISLVRPHFPSHSTFSPLGSVSCLGSWSSRRTRAATLKRWESLLASTPLSPTSSNMNLAIFPAWWGCSRPAFSARHSGEPHNFKASVPEKCSSVLVCNPNLQNRDSWRRKSEIFKFNFFFAVRYRPD